MRFGTAFSLAGTFLLVASVGHAKESARLFVKENPRAVAKSPAALAKAILTDAKPSFANIELSELPAIERTKIGATKIVKLQQRHQGLPVLNRGAGLSIRRDGSTAFAAIQVEEHLPASTIPSIDAKKAATIGEKLSGLDTKSNDARLVVFPTPSGTRLAWLVVPSGRVIGVPHAPVLILDAHSGERLAGWNAVLTAKARVFEANPVSTPNLVDVMLPVVEGALALRNDRVTSVNCIDNKGTKKVQGVDIRVCNLEQKALSDESGDFLHTPAPDDEAEDAFSEVSLFHHTNRAYEYFVDLGMPELPILTTISNLRFAEGFFENDPTHIGDTNRPLLPYQNAFYVGGGSVFTELFEVPGPGLWFGQGPRRDWSYDGDVVYHEFGHAVADHTIRFPFWFHADEQGLIPAGGGMNEGLADYFSSAIAGDSIVGEYAIQDLGLDLKGIRDISAKNACPNDLAGEVHADSLFFSAALWSVRSSLPAASRKSFDRAVFDVLLTAPGGDIGYDDFAELLLVSVGSSDLGESVSETLRSELAARGIYPACERTLLYEGEPLSSTDIFSQHGFWAPGLNDAPLGPLPYAPGVLQFHVPLEQTGHLVVQFEKVQTGPAVATPFRPRVLVRWNEPIRFEWSSSLEDNADTTLTPQTMASANAYRAAVQVPEGATSAYVMIVNAGETQGVYKEVDFAFEPPGDDLPPDVAASDPYATRSKEGCGCEAPGSSPRNGWIAGLTLLAMLGMRRRQKPL